MFKASTLRKLATATGGIIIGNMIAERWILQSAPGDPNGFIPISDGFGLDEIVRAVVIAGSIGATDAVVSMVWK